KRGQNIFTNFFGFFLLAVLFLWMKTYISQLTEFNLNIDNSLQTFLLFLNPLGSALFFLGFAFLGKGKKRYRRLLIIYFLMSFLLYANIMYYRFFSDFITLPTLFQTQNFGDVSGSIVSLLKPYDFLFFIDWIILLALVVFKVVKVETTMKMKGLKVAALYAFAILISTVNLTLAEADRPQLLTRGFDRHYIVKYLGMYNYTIYDAVQSTKASTQRALADSNDSIEVINYTKANYAEPNPKYFGIG